MEKINFLPKLLEKIIIHVEKSKEIILLFTYIFPHFIFFKCKNCMFKIFFNR